MRCSPCRCCAKGAFSARLTVSRKTTGSYPPEVVELLQTFAAQSALAIQNARLFREIEQKSRELESREQAQVAVPRQHEPRAAHAAERHPRLHRADRRSDLRRRAGERSSKCSSACRGAGAICSG